jgi:hypothetical protein
MMSLDVKMQLESTLPRINRQVLCPDSTLALGGQSNDADVGEDLKPAGHVPSSLIYEHHDIGAGCEGKCGLCQAQRHCLGVAKTQEQTRAMPSAGQIALRM